jgi:hypothetical protein
MTPKRELGHFERGRWVPTPCLIGVSDHVMSADEIRAIGARIQADLSPAGLDFDGGDYVQVGGLPRDGDQFAQQTATGTRWYRWEAGAWVRAPDLDARYGGSP